MPELYFSAVAAKSLPTSAMTTPDAEKVFVMTGELYSLANQHYSDIGQ